MKLKTIRLTNTDYIENRLTVAYVHNTWFFNLNKL